MVIAARGDGLGARLCALVNAVALARRLNLPFRFMWPPSVLDPEFNAVSSLESVFSQSFIDDHLDDSLLLGEFIAIDREPVTRDMIEAVRRGDKKGLRIAHLEGPVSTQIGISISGSEIAKTFTELPFAEKIRSALRAADRLERNSAVAVHARRGDIVYGEHRYRLFNSKYVPLAVVRLVIGRIKQQGMQVLLLSDDEPTLARLKEQDQVLIPNDFGAAELSSREERAAFDLGLMARCEKIIAGTSAFTRAAAMYGNVPIMDVLRYAQRATIHSATLEDLSTPGAHYAPLDRAKSLQWIALRLQEVLSAKERDALLQEAAELDPDNLSYWHLRAVDRLRLQKPDEAETMLLEAARLHAAKTAGAALSLTPSFEVLADHSDELAPHAGDPRYPLINAFYAVHLQSIRDFDGAERCLRTATENSDLPLLRALYADHLVARGKHEEARGVIRPVIENGLELPIANYVYGRALKTRPGAYVQFKQAYELAPHVPLFASTWAYYAMQCGELSRRPWTPTWRP